MGVNPLQSVKIPIAGPAAIRDRIGEVRGLIAEGHRRSAFVMAWSLLEAALRALDEDKAGPPRPPGSVVQALAMNGYIDPDMERRIRDLIDVQEPDRAWRSERQAFQRGYRAVAVGGRGDAQSERILKDIPAGGPRRRPLRDRRKRFRLVPLAGRHLLPRDDARGGGGRTEGGGGIGEAARNWRRAPAHRRRAPYRMRSAARARTVQRQRFVTRRSLASARKSSKPLRPISPDGAVVKVDRRKKRSCEDPGFLLSLDRRRHMFSPDRGALPRQGCRNQRDKRCRRRG